MIENSRTIRGNTTLVAYYGDKPSKLNGLIVDIQRELQRYLPGNAFDVYSVEQVHGTIIGLEGYRVEDSIIHKHYYDQRHELKAINFSRLFELLDDDNLFPFAIQLAGYGKDKLYPFTSRGQHPYLRSFSIQGDTAVTIGWPCKQGQYSLSLENIRREFQTAHILHKYHRHPDDIDNDFFFVLGRVVMIQGQELFLDQVQEKLCAFIASYDPIELSIEKEQLSIVVYDDPKLPIATSYSYSIDEAKEKISEITSYYSEKQPN